MIFPTIQERVDLSSIKPRRKWILGSKLTLRKRRFSAEALGPVVGAIARKEQRIGAEIRMDSRHCFPIGQSRNSRSQCFQEFRSHSGTREVGNQGIGEASPELLEVR